MFPIILVLQLVAFATLHLNVDCSNSSFDKLLVASKASPIVFLERDDSTGQRKMNGNLMCQIFLRSKQRSPSIMSRKPFNDLPSWSASIDYCFRYGDAKVVEILLANSPGQSIELVDRQTLFHLMDVCDEVTRDKMSILSSHSPPSSNLTQDPIETDTLIKAFSQGSPSPIAFLERNESTSNGKKIGQPMVLAFLRGNATESILEEESRIPIWGQSLDYCQGIKDEEDIDTYIEGNPNVTVKLINRATMTELKQVCFEVTLQRKGLSGLIASG